jgi:hypothetical protein
MVSATVLYTRQFSDLDNDLAQGQVVGFWDPTTAVLFGHLLNAFGSAQVALAGVIYTGTGPGTVHYVNSAYATLVLPDQNDAGGAQYGNAVPARHVAFCPVSPTVAVLVSAIAQNSYDGPWPAHQGISSLVYYHVLRRASVTATTFTISAGWLGASTWHYPGDTADHGSYSDILVGIAGTPQGAAAIGFTTDWPQPTDKANSYGTIVIHDDDSIDLHWASASTTAAGFGRAAGDALQAPLFSDGTLLLAGPTGLNSVGIPDHNTSTGRPQLIGTLTGDAGSGLTSGRIGWASFTDTTVSFHSYALGAAPAPRYGAPVIVPLTGVPVVAVDLLPGCNRLDYVQVTMTMSDAVQGDLATGIGTATIYGAVVDFRSTPALRTGWTELGTYRYGSIPNKVTVAINDVTDTTITLGWTPATGGTGQGANSYDVFASDTLVGTTVATVFQLANLSSGASYTFQVVPVDVAGNRGEASQPITATTTSPDTGPDTVPPSTPSLTIGGGDEHSVVLYARSSDNIALAGFRIFDITGGTHEQITGAGQDGVTTLDWHIQSPTTHRPYFLLDNSEHIFVAQAFDHAGNISPDSPPVRATLPSVLHPTEVGTPVVDNLGPTSIDFHWGIATVNGSSDGVTYNVYRNGERIGGSSGDNTSYHDEFTLHSEPTYQVQAVYINGWTSLISPAVPQWG